MLAAVHRNLSKRPSQSRQVTRLEAAQLLVSGMEDQVNPGFRWKDTQRRKGMTAGAQFSRSHAVYVSCGEWKQVGVDACCGF